MTEEEKESLFNTIYSYVDELVENELSGITDNLDDKVNTEIENLRSNLKSEINSFINSFTPSKNQIVNNTENIETIQKVLNDYYDKIAIITEDLNKEIERSATKDSSLSDKIDEIKSLYNNVSQTVVNISNNITKIDSNSTTIENKLNDLALNLSSNNSKLNLISLSLDNEINRSKKSDSSTVHDIEELQLFCQNLSNVVANINEKINNFSYSGNTTPTNNIESLSSEISSAKNSISDLYSKLESEISRSKKSDSSTVSELEKLQSLYETLSDKVKTLSSSLSDLSNTKRQDVDLSEVYNEIEKNKDDIESISNQLESEISRSKKSDSSTVSELEKLQSLYESVSGFVDNINTKIKDIEDKFFQFRLNDYDFNGLNQEVEKNRKNIDDLLTQTKNEIERSKLSDNATRVELDNLNSSYVSFENELSNLSKSVEQYLSLNDTSQYDFDYLKNRITTNKESIQDLYNKLASEISRSQISDSSTISNLEKLTIFVNTIDNELHSYYNKLLAIIQNNSDKIVTLEGIEGPQGPQGFQGMVGVQGPQGPAGSASDDSRLTRDIVVSENIGGLKNGETLSKGSSIENILSRMLSVTKYPSITYPSCSITLSTAGEYEVGTTINLQYTASFNKGSYQYDNSTGVEISGWIINSGSNTSDKQSGSFGSITVSDNMSYKLSAKVRYTNGNIPHNNFGEECPELMIPSGTTSVAYSSPITGYRNVFYGCLDTLFELNSNNIRTLSSCKSTTNNFTITTKSTSKVLIIAVPSDVLVKSVLNVAASNAECIGNFDKTTVSVSGVNNISPKNYIVYTYVANIEFGSGCNFSVITL